MPTIPLNVLAFLSEWLALALRMGKKGVACRRIRPQKRHLHSAGHTPEAAFSGNENSFFYTLLGWVPIVLSALPFINRGVFRRFHRNSAGDFAKGLKSAIVARRNRLLTCNSETV